MPNTINEDNIDTIIESIEDIESTYGQISRENTSDSMMPNPSDFSSAAEYDRAMRRYISRNGIPEEKQIIKERNVNTLKDLLSFIKYVKEQLKDNVNKNTPEELNFIEKMLSEEKMMEIVDNYLC